MGKNLSILFYHGPGEIKLPEDVDQVDIILKQSIDEASIVIEDLKRFFDNEISVEDLLKHFKEVNYSGIAY